MDTSVSRLHKIHLAADLKGFVLTFGV